MKLYELSRGSYFRLEPNGVTYYLDHIDGIYSYCFSTFTDEVVHISAFADIIVCSEETSEESS